MLHDIQWIFFDVGSTLVDESAAYRSRILAMLNGTDIAYDDFRAAMIGYYRQGGKGDKLAAAQFGLTLPPWPSEKEVLYPEAADCLRRLKRRFHIGVIANQNPGTRERLAAFGILPFIDLIAASAEEGVAKPDPRLFQIALERADCAPTHAAMVGDRPDNDIAPARRLGMTTVWVRQGFARFAPPPAGDERPDLTVERLDEIPRLFGML